MRSHERGSLEWRDCQTALWNGANGGWEAILGDSGGGAFSRIGAIDLVRRLTGPPAIYLGADSGGIYLYSISPFP